VIIINRGKLVATDSVQNLQSRARGAESVVVEVAGRNGNLDSATVQRRLEQISGVSRVVFKESRDNRNLFEVENQKGFQRGDLARAVVEAGWDLNELRPAAMSLEEIFLQLTGEETPPTEKVAAKGAQ
jgi:ABC-2 type transport system ATP-binding protein